MKTILVMLGVGMLFASPALADLVQPAAPSVGTSVRISEATAAGASAAALSLADAKTNMQSNFVYYGSLNTSGHWKKHRPNGGNDIGNSDNGSDTGGGTDGSANGGNNGINGNGGQVPAPAAGVLAMVGLACASLLRRRV